MKCLIENCEREAVCRGLCWACYQLARRHVIANKGTWDQLVEDGFAKPARKKHGAAAFTLAIHNKQSTTGGLPEFFVYPTRGTISN